MKRPWLLLILVGLATTQAADAYTPGWTVLTSATSFAGVEITVRFETTEADVTMSSASMRFLGDPPDIEDCTNPGEEPLTNPESVRTEAGGSGYHVDGTFQFEAVPPCNGMYPVELHAVASRAPRCGLLRNEYCEPFQGYPSAVLPFEIAPIEPSDVTATANNDRSVKVTWTPPYNEDDPAPPDFLGYEVVRIAADDSEAVVATQLSDVTEFTDKALPAAGGTFTYEVVSLRPDANGEPFASDAAASEPVTVKAAPADSTSTVPSTPTNGNTGGVITSPPRTRSSGSSTRPTLPRPTTTTLPDQGYETELPYESEPGEEEARPPEDVLDLRERNDDGGTGLVRPVAVSLVLGLWAMHVLYVTRAAQRANQLAPNLVVTPEPAPPPPPPPPPPPSAAPVDDWLHPFDDNDPMKWWSNNP